MKKIIMLLCALCLSMPMLAQEVGKAGFLLKNIPFEIIVRMVKTPETNVAAWGSAVDVLCLDERTPAEQAALYQLAVETGVGEEVLDLLRDEIETPEELDPQDEEAYQQALALARALPANQKSLFSQMNPHILQPGSVRRREDPSAQKQVPAIDAKTPIYIVVKRMTGVYNDAQRLEEVVNALDPENRPKAQTVALYELIAKHGNIDPTVKDALKARMGSLEDLTAEDEVSFQNACVMTIVQIYLCR